MLNYQRVYIAHFSRGLVGSTSGSSWDHHLRASPSSSLAAVERGGASVGRDWRGDEELGDWGEEKWQHAEPPKSWDTTLRPIVIPTRY